MDESIDNTGSGQRVNPSGWLALGLCAVAIAALYLWLPYATGYGQHRRSIGYWLWHFWRDPDWQHGAMAIPILAVLLWRGRSKLFGESSARPPVQGSWWGLLIVAVALFSFYVGYLANIYYLGFLSGQLLAAGFIVWLGGWKWFGRLLFFWCLLGFVWPLYFLESRLGFPLRMLMTDISSGVLDVLSVEHLRQGTALLSPADAASVVGVGEVFALEVDDPCSGIRSLFSLTMVGAILGFVAFPKGFRWLLIAAAAVPLAVLGNAVRILLLLAASKWFGSDFAIGKDGSPSLFHMAAGIAVFLVALSGMATLVRLIGRCNDRSKTVAPVAAPASLGRVVEPS